MVGWEEAEERRERKEGKVTRQWLPVVGNTKLAHDGCCTLDSMQMHPNIHPSLHALAYSFLVFLTLIFERTYAGLPCDLRLTPDFSSCRVAGLCGRPSIVLDGSSACVCVSDRECLVRHSGAVSARLASASVIRMDGGKMETAWKKGKGLLESLSWMFVLVSKKIPRGKSASSDMKFSTMSTSREWNRSENSCLLLLKTKF